MSKNIINTDTSQLDAFAERLRKGDKLADECMRSCMNALTGRLLRWTMDRTPRRTSRLARGWEVSDINVSDSKYTAKLYNNVEYAPYVEYGHRTRNGHGWVDGYFMMTQSVNLANERKDQIIDPILKKYLQEIFK